MATHFKGGMACPVCAGGVTYQRYRAFRGHWTERHQRFVRRFQCPACSFQARTLHGAQHHTKRAHQGEGHRFEETRQRNRQFVSPGLVSMPRPPTGTSGPAPPKGEPWRERLVEEKRKRHEADDALRIRVKQLECARTRIRSLEGELKKRAYSQPRQEDIMLAPLERWARSHSPFVLD